jgi:hypothetical protein
MLHLILLSVRNLSSAVDTFPTTQRFVQPPNVSVTTQMHSVFHHSRPGNYFVIRPMPRISSKTYDLGLCNKATTWECIGRNPSEFCVSLPNSYVFDSSRNTNEAKRLWRVATRTIRKGRGMSPASFVSVTSMISMYYVDNIGGGGN